MRIDRLYIERVIQHSSLPYRGYCRGINALQAKRVSSSQKCIRIKYTGTAEAYSKRRGAVNLVIFRARFACNPGIVPLEYIGRKKCVYSPTILRLWRAHRYETSSVVIRVQFENREVSGKRFILTVKFLSKRSHAFSIPRNSKSFKASTVLLSRERERESIPVRRIHRRESIDLQIR